VAVTGHVEQKYKKLAYMSGMQRILSKPVQCVDLAELLLAHLLQVRIPPKLKQPLSGYVQQTSSLMSENH